MRIWQRAAIGMALIFSSSAHAEPVWREDATKLYRDLTLHLPWGNSLGDWRDAKGAPLGAEPFASVTAARTVRTAPNVVRLDVTALVRAYGADFRINSVDGYAVLASHRAPSGGPELRITRAGQTHTLTASADTTMDPTTFKPLDTLALLQTHYGALVRFEQPADRAIEHAELRLTVLNTFGRTPRLLVFRPVVLTGQTAVTPGGTFAPDRPAALRTNPRVLAKLHRLGDEPVRGGSARVILNLTGAQIRHGDNAKVDGGLISAWVEGSRMAALSDIHPLPGALTDAYATVVLKLDPNWVAPGGKLPGLANTGQLHLLAPCIVHGLPAAPSGWGGRPADGCHWSARTGFRGVRDGSIGSGTYFYALSPADATGVADYWSQALPKARWVAYVEHVKLNDPQRANGEIAYWLIDRATAPNGKRVQGAGGIIWRDTAVPQSAINELWIDVFCGGHDCGAAPWPRSTIHIARATVTDGMPDMTAIEAELDGLNAGR